MEVLAGVRVRSASAGSSHYLAVTIKGALYSLGMGGNRQLGHSSVPRLRSPKIVRSLRHVHITAAAGGGYHFLALTKDGLLVGLE